VLAKTSYEYLHLPGLVIGRNFYPGRHRVGQAIGMLALFALKVQVIIVVVALATVILAEAVFYSALIIQYFMDDACFLKGFEGAIDGYPIEGVLGEGFKLALRQSISLTQKNIEQRTPGRRIAELLFL
jgi:hypothetical protein